MSEPAPAPEAPPAEAPAPVPAAVPARRPAVSVTTPPREWSVIVAQAEVLARSMIVPAAYRGRPQNIVVAALTGRMFGWDVTATMRNGHVIEGVYGIKPEASLGLIRSAGHKVQKIAEEHDDDGRVKSVTVRGTRADTGETLECTWTWQMALDAGLTRKDNWQKYRHKMLYWRAVGDLVGELFSDVSLGLSYSPEELGSATAVPGADWEIEAEGETSEAIPTEPAPVLPPPEGWANWEECDQAHEAYIARWRAAPEATRKAMTSYAKGRGFERPMDKLSLEELEGQLDIEDGPRATRVGPQNVGGGGSTDAPATDDTAASSPGEAGDAPVQAAAEPAAGDEQADGEPATAPAADDAVVDGEIVEEGSTEAPAVHGEGASHAVDPSTAHMFTPQTLDGEGNEITGPSTCIHCGFIADHELHGTGVADAEIVAPSTGEVDEPFASSSGDGPPSGGNATGDAPGGSEAPPAPEPPALATKTQRNKFFAAVGKKSANLGEPARKALLSFVSGGRTRSTTEITGEECERAVNIAQKIRAGDVGLELVGEEGAESITMAAYTQRGVSFIQSLTGEQPELTPVEEVAAEAGEEPEGLEGF